MDSDACWLSCEMHQVVTSVPTGLFREDSFYFILYHISLSLAMSLCFIQVYFCFRSGQQRPHLTFGPSNRSARLSPVIFGAGLGSPPDPRALVDGTCLWTNSP